MSRAPRPPGEAEEARFREIVRDHAAAIFDDLQEAPEILGVRLSRALHYRDPSEDAGKVHNDPFYHRLMEVEYASRDGGGRRKVWLKFGTDLKPSFELHRYAYEGMKRFEGFIPRPYFLHEGPASGEQFIAMDYVEGSPFRHGVLRSLLWHRASPELISTFEDIGRRMRAFHDMSPRMPGHTVAMEISDARACLETTPHLNAAEKARIAAHINTIAPNLNPSANLPAVYRHNDWAMRNFIRSADGNLTLIDLDSMRSKSQGSLPSSRWYEVLYFLINLECQMKYAPAFSVDQVSSFARAFVQGYFADGPCEYVPAAHLPRLLYLMKVSWTCGGIGRRSLFAKFAGRLDRRYLSLLVGALGRGRFGLLDVEGTIVERGR